MKFLVPRERLTSALQAVEHGISEKSTLPVLSNMLLRVEGGHVEVVGTDLDIGISCRVPVQVVQEGATTVPGRRLAEIVRELSESDVTLEAKKNHVTTIECERSFFKLLGLPVTEFPQLPSFHDRQGFGMPQQVLKDMLRRTSFAVSHDETRHVLNGLLVRVQGGLLRLVATDGRRLALVEEAVPAGTLAVQVIVPLRAIQQVARLLGESGDVTLAFDENQMAFTLGTTRIVTRLIEGRFPDYEQVIPKEATQKVRLRREPLLLATRRAALLTNSASPSVRIHLSPDTLVVSKDSPEVGEVRDELDVLYGGRELTIGFNPSYLIDFLRSVEDEEIDLELTGPESPGVVRIGQTYLYIVLPMQL